MSEQRHAGVTIAPPIPRIPSLDLAAHSEPPAHTGGDCYDFLRLAGGRWGILVADACGHGREAALEIDSLRALAHVRMESETTPGGMLEYLNEELSADFEQGNFVTAFFGIYDPRTHVLEYASAGHPAPRAKGCGDGAFFRLESPQGLPLGVLPNQRYVDVCRRLKPGDQIVLYTDGITEACNPRRERFGTRGLDLQLQHCGRNATSLARSVLAALDRFTEGRRAADDRTLVVARVTSDQTTAAAA